MTAKKQPEQITFNLISHYLKDLSFESPQSPQIFSKLGTAPDIDFNIDIDAKKLNEETFEVTITASVNATEKEKKDSTIFVIECKYSGIFTLVCKDKKTQEEILLIECPNILFPYLRRIISDSSRDGGFPPVMMSHIDFRNLYLNNKNKKGTVN
jgi:preprotein translocase subunit SecB